jgi:hypothetical protein
MLPSTAVGLHKDTIALQVDDLLIALDFIEEKWYLLHRCCMRLRALICVNAR